LLKNEAKISNDLWNIEIEHQDILPKFPRNMIFSEIKVRAKSDSETGKTAKPEKWFTLREKS
jgi:hypothetical protein